MVPQLQCIVALHSALLSAALKKFSVVCHITTIFVPYICCWVRCIVALHSALLSAALKKIIFRLPQYNNCCTVHLLLSISIYVFHLFTAQSVPRQVHSPVVYLMDIITVWMIYIVIFSLQDCGMYCMQVTILFHRITRQSITQHFIYTQK